MRQCEYPCCEADATMHGGLPTSVCLTHYNALTDVNCCCKSDQELVAEFRERMSDVWPHPPVMDTWAWLVTEVGEVGDQLMRNGFGQRIDYVRHHDRKSDTLYTELADTYIMLLTLANHVGVDLPHVLRERLVRIEKRVTADGAVDM